MAEEFGQLPEALKHISSTLVHNRRSRNAFICGIILVMSIASSVGLFFGAETYFHSKTSLDLSVLSYPMFLKANEITKENNFDKRNPQQNIVVNFILTANVQQNITLNNNYKIDNEIKYNISCLKHLINITNANSTDILEDDENENMIKLNNSLTTNEDVFYKTKKDKLFNLTIHNRISRSIIESSLNKSFLSEKILLKESTDDFVKCCPPEYIVYCWVLCLIALATALKLYYLIKTFLAVIMVSCYALFILVPYNDIFNSPAVNKDKE